MTGRKLVPVPADVVGESPVAVGDVLEGDGDGEDDIRVRDPKLKNREVAEVCCCCWVWGWGGVIGDGVGDREEASEMDCDRLE